MPLFSILTPVHDPPVHLFLACIASVIDQSDSDWEFIVADDGSQHEGVRAMLAELATSDPRIRVERRETSGGIVAATNTALALATGEFVVLLDHDDHLLKDALAHVREVIDADPLVDYIYSDEEKMAEDGSLFDAFYKPDWSPERLRSQNYCTHLSVLRRSIVEEVGGFRDGFDGSQDHDLILRVTERARHVGHVPKVLYRWCATPGSTATDSTAKPWAREAGRRAVEEHCARVGIDATVEQLGTPGHYRVRRNLPAVPPMVSIVIPTAGVSRPVWGIDKPLILRALQSVIELTTYPRYEVVIVIDPITPLPVRASLERWQRDDERVRLIDGVSPFNYSERVNLGAANSAGEILLLLNDDIDVVTPDWLETMTGFLQEPDVGAVGAKLLYADGRLQHGGHLYSERPMHIFHGYGGDDPGVFGLLEIDREVSGVTAACMAVRRDVWDEVGGFDLAFPVAYNDVDFCLRLRPRRIIWTPHAVLHHFESQTRPGHATDEELDLILSRWGEAMESDPYGNPNLAPGEAQWVPAIRTRGFHAGFAKLRELLGGGLSSTRR